MAYDTTRNKMDTNSRVRSREFDKLHLNKQLQSKNSKLKTDPRQNSTAYRFDTLTLGKMGSVEQHHPGF